MKHGSAFLVSNGRISQSKFHINRYTSPFISLLLYIYCCEFGGLILTRGLLGALFELAKHKLKQGIIDSILRTNHWQYVNV